MDNEFGHGIDARSADWATIPMRRISVDQGKGATVVSGTDGDRQALIGALELMESSANDSMNVLDFIAWCDEYLVKPGYMRSPTRVFESGVGTVYLGASMAHHPGQDAMLRRILVVVRQKVSALLRGLLNDPPDERFLSFLVATGRVYSTEFKQQRSWRIRARPDDRLRDIVMSLFASDILSNRHVYDERLSVCNECGRISFRIERKTRERCSVHGPAPHDKPDVSL